MESNARSVEHRTARNDAEVVLAACAISAGAHAALIPSHMDHAPRLGLAFVVAVGVLLTVGAAVVLSPGTARAAQAAALVFALKLNQTVGGRWSLTRQEVSR